MKYLQQDFYRRASSEGEKEPATGADAAIWKLFKWFLIALIPTAILLMALVHFVNSSPR
jgi:hypothetical protein